VKRESGGYARPREARLLPEAAHLYPGVRAGVWIQAASMSDIVWARRLQRTDGAPRLSGRVLDPDHFEFRHGGAQPANPERLRRRATDRLRLGGD
jgi:hypothetical protein